MASLLKNKNGKKIFRVNVSMEFGKERSAKKQKALEENKKRRKKIQRAKGLKLLIFGEKVDESKNK